VPSSTPRTLAVSWNSYSSVAGIERRRLKEGFAVLGTKPSQFLIVRMPKRLAETIDIIAPPEPREDTPIQLVFGVKDIAHARDRAAELGGAMKAWNASGNSKASRFVTGP